MANKRNTQGVRFVGFSASKSLIGKERPDLVERELETENSRIEGRIGVLRRAESQPRKWW